MYDEDDEYVPTQTPVDTFVQAVFGPVVLVVGIGVAIALFTVFAPILVPIGILCILGFIGNVTGFLPAFIEGFKKGMAEEEPPKEKKAHEDYFHNRRLPQ